MANEPKEVVLPDSGATVRVKFVGPLLLNDLRKAAMRGLTKPRPPQVVVAYPQGERAETNENDPDYRVALTEYDTTVGMRFLEKLIRYGVDYTLTEADQTQVAALKSDPDLELGDLTDLHVFVSRCLVQTDRDLEALQAAILGYAQPTEAQVAAAADTFRGDLPGT